MDPLVSIPVEQVDRMYSAMLRHCDEYLGYWTNGRIL
jgi:hypothetical protein